MFGRNKKMKMPKQSQEVKDATYLMYMQAFQEKMNQVAIVEEIFRRQVKRMVII
jgi:radical SAM superfamily enzyme